MAGTFHKSKSKLRSIGVFGRQKGGGAGLSPPLPTVKLSSAFISFGSIVKQTTHTHDTHKKDKNQEGTAALPAPHGFCYLSHCTV